MFDYDEDDPNIIIGCDSSAFNSSSIATDIFKEGQIWKDRALLYSTVKVFAMIIYMDCLYLRILLLLHDTVNPHSCPFPGANLQIRITSILRYNNSGW